MEMTDVDRARDAGDRLGDGLDDGLDDAQLAGLADMDPERFREAAHAAVDLMADYLANVERYPVLPAVEPGSIAPQLPPAAPEDPEPIGTILEDVARLVPPNATHWQHPGFFAYFASTAAGPGILGEMLGAAFAQNVMLWRTSPVGTELEGVVVDWLRQALGLPPAFDGLLTDTASISSLVSLAAAREAIGADVAMEGLPGRADVPRLRVYASQEAHSSIDKAAMTIGLGRAGVRRIETDEAYRMDVAALERAIREDRAAGIRPIAIVATLGTTSSTSIDPVAAIADVAALEGLWLHVDAAYAGPVAMIPARRDPFEGWERADSIVANPHKWLFTPFDASLLLSRRLPVVRSAFSLVPEYLRTLDQSASGRDYNEYVPQLGRRFRALKLWILLRYFGLSGLRRRLEHHIDLAERFARWVDDDPDWERLAPVPFSTVCFRYRPAALAGREDEPGVRAHLDEVNARIMAGVNRGGEVFLSHTRLRDRFTIRLAVGNLRTEERHVERAWELLREEAASAAAAAPADRDGFVGA
jgi:aromatic-L-amino-acid decarboxylase